MRTRDPRSLVPALLLGASAALAALSAGAIPFPPVIDLGQLNGEVGFVLNGVSADDRSGIRVAGAGDVDNDGFDDIIIGAYRADPGGRSRAGASYVVFGQESFSASIELSSLDGSTGFVLNGVASNDESGFSVAGAGDVDNDGFDDLLIGAAGADPGGLSGAGETYVIYGAASFSQTFNLSGVNGSNGFVLNGVDDGDQSGISVAGIGDFNGDGFDDLIVGAHLASPQDIDAAGASYLIYGATGFPADSDLAELNGANGFALTGIDPNDRSGYSVAGAGDLNKDGFADAVIGAFQADPDNMDAAGEAYVIFGKDSAFPPIASLDQIDGNNGFTLVGGATFDNAGRSVMAAGDLNGDSFDDLVVAAWAADPDGLNNAGEVYVIFGRTVFPEVVDLSELTGVNGFRIQGLEESAFLGQGMAAAGDVNADGIDDLLLSAYLADPVFNTNAGQSYLIYGRRTFDPVFDLATLDGTNGFTINGIEIDDHSGWSVAGAGDMNADGFDDIAIAAYNAGPNGDGSGETYVVFGGPGSPLLLAIGGSCPGVAGIAVTGAIPDGLVAFFAADEQGISEIESGPCAGTELGLTNAKLGFALPADDEGAVNVLQPISVCGRYAQVVDITTCTVSNVEQLPLEEK